MIVKIAPPIYARPGDVVRIKADLIPQADEIGNYSIETANPGYFWGAAIQQLPRDAIMPKTLLQTAVSGIVHMKEPKQELLFPCLYPTWVRVVQYLNAGEVPSVKAKIEIMDLRIRDRLKRYFSNEKIDPPKERVY